MPNLLPRRHLLAALALPALQGCAAPLPPLLAATSSPAALALLAGSADAHGRAALQSVHDISVGYAGQWHAFVDTIQPDLVDAGYRQSSQERLLPAAGLVAQTHSGPAGRKQVLRRTIAGTAGDVHVWLDGVPSTDPNRLAAAALVADGYSLFLLGPMLLAAGARGLVMELAEPERLTIFGNEIDCDVLRIQIRPGLGLSAQDDLALCIARQDRLLRRVRFTLNGLEATIGAVAEVDTASHVPLHGMQWPTRFHERLLRPVPIPVHDWRLTGLDLNRGLAAADLDGATLPAKAAVPAGTGARPALDR